MAARWLILALFAPFAVGNGQHSSERDDLVMSADARQEILTRAAVRLPEPLWKDVPSDPEITCRFLPEEPTGTTPKFDCLLGDGRKVKVKYGRNPEIHAETAGARLLALLGFPADHVYIARRVRCYGCPRYPFFTMRSLTALKLRDRLDWFADDDRPVDFEWAAVEHRLPAYSVETADTKGWGWWELKAPQYARPGMRADLDEFRLLAVFLAHWDNKASNQRLACLEPACTQPILMMQDMGAWFGPYKTNLGQWKSLPVWADRHACRVTMRHLPFQGATFPDAQISEAGRRQLASRLSAIPDSALEAMFTEARFGAFHSGTDDAEDVAAWTAVFRDRARQIADAGPCPQ